MTITESKFYELWLNNIQGIGGATSKLLISHLGSAEDVFKSSPTQLKKVSGIGEHTIHSIGISKKYLKKIDLEVQKIESANVRVLSYTDDEFPKRLKYQKDSPYLIYVKGKAKGLYAKKTIGIVGSRSANYYGKSVTNKLIEDLSKFKDIAVISGLAYGIDIQAHKSSLSNNVGTIGVMANGLNKVYPSMHKNTAIEMIKDDNSGLITENLMDAEPDGPKFPARNRIIAGLSDVIIVIQGKKKGGALITADIANSYHKEVFAVPGQVNDELAEGCNNLIKYQKARIYTSADDIIKMMNWDIQEKNNTQKTLFDTSDLSKDELSIVDLLKENEYHIEELAIQLQTPIPKLSGFLLQLELRGIIRLKPGNIYSLK
ncbi:DNA-processing protein DprA [Flammeovirga yaeyamensis]|uniref:DNA-processing protein DprA n=1 Tax=Flammeovirga yaeyamensis TaxID=367791 RepID=A0AAX1MY68_9BACT|nr:DNA-processing protein DprA [Flammeovirga yaeyamensis]MBB3696295.1 DNA processing protein [Flammeovirga yaeyamensis]NMF34974.1 DNA-protecting protein DprA [Flammeovirga yaeyamensis]QWG00199.1 DNA-processing protein DprA [Flammeovirga yaeyamensis]